MEQMGLFEAMFSQRQITRFKPDPVPREAIEKIIEAAIKAPSGGNTQSWHFVAITDPGLISRIGEIYKELWLGARRSQAEPGETTVYRAARYLANHMPEVPAMILICADHSANYTPGQPIERGRHASSIWLAVQNLFLAARALGLGTRLTTAHIRREQEIKDMLVIPDYVETVALTPIGYPRGRFGPTDRKPAAEVSSYNRWGSRG
ncbi:MAG: nitroreductase family protein [Chloroflexota bacterium]|nr:nitroreductase family protein [Chloroflexota bacterium]